MSKKETSNYNFFVLGFFILLLFVGVVYFLFKSSTSGQVHASNPRVGILGDSDSDEYRADDNRAGGTPYAATTLSWDELLQKYRGFDFGSWGTWGGERRTGYAYNWARSGATTHSMITTGQYTGLAQQIANGEVDYAIIFIGSNDFNRWNGTYKEAYDTLSDAQLQAKVDGIVSDISLAVDTLKHAGNAKIILANFGDPAVSVDFLQEFPDATKRLRVSNAVIQIDQKLAELATTKQITLVDLNSFAKATLSRADSQGNVIIGGEAISATVHGDEPHHFQLGDSAHHFGTVGDGLLANVFGSALAKAGNITYTPFSDTEILANAGIGVQHTSPSPSPSPSPSSSPAQTPRATASPLPSPVNTPFPTSSPTAAPSVKPSPSPVQHPSAVPSARPTTRPQFTPRVTPRPVFSPMPVVTPAPITSEQQTQLRSAIATFYQQHKTEILQAFAKWFGR